MKAVIWVLRHGIGIRRTYCGEDIPPTRYLMLQTTYSCLQRNQLRVNLYRMTTIFFYLNNEYTLELEDENFNVVSSDENDLSDSDNISETSGSPQAEQEASTQPDSYFPFPSEIFFLLYSYAHNITRPKVTYFTIYLTNIFNQVLFCKKWLPLLLAGLNSTVECCWNNIVQCC